jgi:hypothetical protein
MTLLCAWTVLGALALPAPADAQARRSQSPQAERSGERPAAQLQVYAYTFRRRQAADARELVESLLSARGRVEVQEASNTLVVRDSVAAITRIVPVLRNFDREPREVRVQVMIVSAVDRLPDGDGHRVADVPVWLRSRLRENLPWRHFDLLAEASLTVGEGQTVTHELSGGYGVGFEIGPVVGRQVKLEGVEIWRHRPSPSAVTETIIQRLMRADLNLRIDQPMALTLAKSAASDRGLVLVLICRHAEPEEGS